MLRLIPPLLALLLAPGGALAQAAAGIEDGTLFVEVELAPPTQTLQLPAASYGSDASEAVPETPAVPSQSLEADLEGVWHPAEGPDGLPLTETLADAAFHEEIPVSARETAREAVRVYRVGTQVAIESWREQAAWLASRLDHYDIMADTQSYQGCDQPYHAGPFPGVQGVSSGGAGLGQQVQANRAWADGILNYHRRCTGWQLAHGLDALLELSLAAADAAIVPASTTVAHEATIRASGVPEPSLPSADARLGLQRPGIAPPVRGVRLLVELRGFETAMKRGFAVAPEPGETRSVAAGPATAEREETMVPREGLPAGLTARHPEVSGARVTTAPAAVASLSTVGPESRGPPGGSTAPAATAWLAFLGLATLLLVAPLLHRLRASDTLLRLDLRKRLYDLLETPEGMTAGEAARASGVSRLTARYHLQLLQDHGLVTSQGVGNRVVFHRNGCGASREQRRAHSALRNPAARALLAAIATDPDRSLRGLARSAHLQLSTAYWHLNRLETLGMLSTRREPRRITFALTPEALEVVRDVQAPPAVPQASATGSAAPA